MLLFGAGVLQVCINVMSRTDDRALLNLARGTVCEASSYSLRPAQVVARGTGRICGEALCFLGVDAEVLNVALGQRLDRDGEVGDRNKVARQDGESNRDGHDMGDR